MVFLRENMARSRIALVGHTAIELVIMLTITPRLLRVELWLSDGEPVAYRLTQKEWGSCSIRLPSLPAS